MVVEVTLKVFLVAVFVAHFDHVLSLPNKQPFTKNDNLFDDNPGELPHFGEPFYFGTLIDGVLGGLEVTVVNGLEKPVIIVGDDESEIKKVFEVNLKAGTNDKFIVKTKNGQVWNKNVDAVFTLKVDDPTLNPAAETVVIIKTEPKKNTHFEKSSYGDSLVEGVLGGLEVTVVDGLEKPVIIVGDDDSEIKKVFEVNLKTGTNDKFIVKTKNGQVWNKNVDAVFTLKVDDPTLNPAVETVVIIKTEPKKNTHFEKSSYGDNLVEGVLGGLEVTVVDGLEKPVIIVGDDDSEIKKVFEVNLKTGTNDKFIVKTKNGQVWNKNVDAVFTLKVDDPTLNPAVETVVIIKTEPKKNTHFEQSSYGDNLVEGVLRGLEVTVVDGLEKPVIIVGDDDSEIKKVFEVNLKTGTNDKFIVKTKNGQVWNKNIDAVFTLKVDDPTLNPAVETVVIIKTEPKKNTHFEKSSYGDNLVEGVLGGLEVTVVDGLEKPVIIVGDDDSEIKKIFEVNLKTGTNDKFIVKTKNGQVWNKNVDAVFTLKVDDPTLNPAVETVVIIKTEPKKNTHFEQSSYSENLVEGVLGGLEVTVVDGLEKPVIIVGDDDSEIKKVFEVNLKTGTNDKFIVKTKNGQVWNKNVDAVFTLKVDDPTLNPAVETVVIIKTEPKKNTHFEKSSYGDNLVEGVLGGLEVTVVDGLEKPVIIVGDDDSEIKKVFEVNLKTGTNDKFIVKTKNGQVWNKNVDAVFTLKVDDPTLNPAVETVVIIKTEPKKNTHFEQSSYGDNLVEGVLGGLEVTVVDGLEKPVIIVGDDDSEIKKVFEVNLKTGTNDKFIVKTKNGQVWNKNIDAVFTLKVDDPTLNPAVETVVIIKTEPKKNTHFEKSSYGDNLVEGVLGGLEVTVVDGLEKPVIIVGDDDSEIKKIFEVNLKTGTNDKFIVKTKNGQVWNKNVDAVFTLKVDDPTLNPAVETVVIIKTEPKKNTHFEQSSYSENLVEGVLGGLEVTVVDGLEKPVIIVGDDDSEIKKVFEVNLKTGTNDKFIVKTKNGQVWNKNVDAVFTLKVDDPTLNPAVETVVIIKTEPKKNTHFEQSSYSENLVEGVLGGLEVTVVDGFEKPVIIVGDDDSEIKTVFQVNPKSGTKDKFIVKTKDGQIWNKNVDAVFTLRIDDPTLYPVVETILIIKIEKVNEPEPPRFEMSHYSGTYKNGELTDLDNIKLLGNKKGNVRIEDSEEAKSFQAKNTNGLVTIEKTGAIKPELKEILLIVIAERDGLEGSTAVLIKIDADSAPTFDKSSYEGVYDGSNFIVDKITLANYHSGDVVVDTPYDEYFQAKNEDGVVTIGKTGSYDKLKEPCVWLKLHLKDSNVILTTASVFLTIAKKSGSSPKFDSCFYQAAYDGDQLYFDLIQVENPDDVEIELSDPKQEDLVKVKFENGRVALEKQPGLDDFTGDQLIVKIKIKTKQRDTSEEEAVLVLTINKRAGKTPYFKKAYQLVEYVSSASSLALLDVANGEYGNVKLVEQEYADYVDVKFDKSKVEVTKKKELFDLEKDTLVLTFVVTDAKEAVAGSAVLVVTMKREVEEVEEASSDSGLIAGIAVLGSLLALFIIASLAFWYFKLRKRSAPYGNMMEDRKD